MAKSFFTFFILAGLVIRVSFPSLQSVCHIWEKIKNTSCEIYTDLEESADEESSEEETKDNKTFKTLEDFLMPFSFNLFVGTLSQKFFNHHNLDFSDHFLEKVSPPPKF
jgi:hypothetical protein